MSSPSWASLSLVDRDVVPSLECRGWPRPSCLRAVMSCKKKMPIDVVAVYLSDMLSHAPSSCTAIESVGKEARDTREA